MKMKIYILIITTFLSHNIYAQFAMPQISGLTNYDVRKCITMNGQSNMQGFYNFQWDALNDNLESHFGESIDSFYFALGGSILNKFTYSSGVAYDWSPSSHGELNDDLYTTWQLYCENAASQGYVPDVISIIWIQGENDRYHPINYNNYYENQQSLIRQFRYLFRTDQEFIYQRLSNQLNDLGPGFSTMVAASNSTQSANEIMILTDGFELSDGLHYSNLGLIDMRSAIEAIIINN